MEKSHVAQFQATFSAYFNEPLRLRFVRSFNGEVLFGEYFPPGLRPPGYIDNLFDELDFNDIGAGDRHGKGVGEQKGKGKCTARGEVRGLLVPDTVKVKGFKAGKCRRRGKKKS